MMVRILQSCSKMTCVLMLFVHMSIQSNAQITEKEAARAAKITPDLLNAQPNANRGTLASSSGPQRVNRFQFDGDRIAIEAIAAPGQDGQALLRELTALGLRGGIVYKRLVFGYLPLDKLGELRTVSALQVARPAYKPLTNTTGVISQGDRAMKAEAARRTYGVTGAGVKVGVLSDSYNALGGAAAGVDRDDLPPNVEVLDDFLMAGATDEGRAMAEIVHDVAPGAAIAFHTANKGQAGFAQGIKALAAAGCNIITDDVTYFAEPFFQDGIIAQAIDEVVKHNNVTYFAHASNNGRSSYQSQYQKGKLLADSLFGDLGEAHNFGGGDYYQKITIPPGATANFIFQWTDPFASVGERGAQTDMDFFVFYQGKLRPDLSSFNPNIGNDPLEFVGIINPSDRPMELELVLAKVVGPDPTLIKWINFDNAGGRISIEYDTKSSTIYGHNNSDKGIVVGAAPYYETPAFNLNLSTANIEFFSSAGGTPIFFDPNGHRISHEGIVRQNPDIVAPDGGNNSFFGLDFEGDGFPNFFGTSAAAPHAAGVGALIQEKAKKHISPDAIAALLTQTALDMDDLMTPTFDKGFDFRTGYGFIQADKALEQLAPQPLALLEPEYDCQTGAITFRTSGGNSQPIRFMAIGVTGWTTEPKQTVDLGVRADPKMITLMARQDTTVVTRGFDLPAFCQGRVTIDSLALLEPEYNCQTGEITFQTNGGNGQTIEFMAIGVTGWTTDSKATVDLGVRADPKMITLMARQTGVVVTRQFDLPAVCQGQRTISPLALLEPEYDCQTGAINFRTSGGNGQMIEFMAIGVTDWTTNSKATVEAALRENPKVLRLMARQTGVVVTSEFDLAAVCQSQARIAVSEKTQPLHVNVLGNPVSTELAVEVTGATNQLLLLRLVDTKGRVIETRQVGQAAAIERQTFDMSRQSPGLLLLQTTTGQQQRTNRILKK